MRGKRTWYSKQDFETSDCAIAITNPLGKRFSVIAAIYTVKPL